ncbi:DNA (cytosine-5)-methyltransferase DRM2, partial [Camellia lanceoleosa]
IRFQGSEVGHSTEDFKHSKRAHAIIIIGCTSDDESTNDSLEKDGTVSLLMEMGYEAKKVLTAIDRCGLYLALQRCIIACKYYTPKSLCATARKRGYIHNFPIGNRFQLLLVPSLTIHEAFPLTKKWRPKWDKRSKLNCLLTCVGSAKLSVRIRKGT